MKAHKTVDNERAVVDRAAATRTATYSSGLVDERQTKDAAEVEFNRHAKYPLGMLCGIDAAELPAQVDPQNKELHLTYDDFMAVFAMQVGDFEALPAWRKQALKKKHGLF